MTKRLGLVVAALVLAACSSSTTADPSTTVASTTTDAATTTSTTAAPTTTSTTTTLPPTTTTEPPTPPPDPAALRTVRTRLEPVADLPLLTAGAADDTNGNVYLTSQTGEVWLLPPGGAPTEVLDLTGEVSPYADGSERGLLGVAVGPVDHRLYLSFTDAQIDSHVVSYALDDAGRPVAESRRQVFFEDQPSGGLGHKGGGLAFEPDGTMYLALGDGGASDGLDAQDFGKLLGAVLRIVPNPDADGYTVPTGNPFVNQPGIRPELWAKGLRNPWGFCRDDATGDLWLSDVGNRTMEEIDRIPAGQGGLNFGWYWIEGSFVRVGGAPAGLTPPVFTYRHDDIGLAAIGGCVYRGTSIPTLRGAYVFADLAGRFFAIGAGDVTVELTRLDPSPITGFVTLPDGEMLVLTLYQGVFRLLPA